MKKKEQPDKQKLLSLVGHSLPEVYSQLLFLLRKTLFVGYFKQGTIHFFP